MFSPFYGHMLQPKMTYKPLFSRLQELYETYQNVIQLKKKAKSVIETLKKSKKLTLDVEKSILNARNLSELDLVVSKDKIYSKPLNLIFFYYILDDLIT